MSALDRGLEALSRINALQQASVADVQQACGGSRAAAQRLLDALCAAGYVARDEPTELYSPTAKCLQLSRGCPLHGSLARVARAPLAEFGARVGWPSHLAVFTGTAMEVVLASGSFSISAYNRGVGTRGSMLMSSNGRAYLGFCQDDERERVLQALRLSNNPFDAIARDRAKVDRLLKTVRRQGYGTSDTAYVKAVYNGALHGISLPIRAGDQVVGAVNVMFLRNSLTLAEGVAQLLPELRAVAAIISADLTRDIDVQTRLGGR
ncbi:MAG: IclR family transcriptional regulator C-terminal domain-containing protein [Burkholderiaceae bacterium]